MQTGLKGATLHEENKGVPLFEQISVHATIKDLPSQLSTPTGHGNPNVNQAAATISDDYNEPNAPPHQLSTENMERGSRSSDVAWRCSLSTPELLLFDQATSSRLPALPVRDASAAVTDYDKAVEEMLGVVKVNGQLRRSTTVNLTDTLARSQTVVGLGFEGDAVAVHVDLLAVMEQKRRDEAHHALLARLELESRSRTTRWSEAAEQLQAQVGACLIIQRFYRRWRAAHPRPPPQPVQPPPEPGWQALVAKRGAAGSRAGRTGAFGVASSRALASSPAPGAGRPTSRASFAEQWLAQQGLSQAPEPQAARGGAALQSSDAAGRQPGSVAPASGDASDGKSGRPAAPASSMRSKTPTHGVTRGDVGGRRSVAGVPLSPTTKSSPLYGSKATGAGGDGRLRPPSRARTFSGAEFGNGVGAGGTRGSVAPPSPGSASRGASRGSMRPSQALHPDSPGSQGATKLPAAASCGPSSLASTANTKARGPTPTGRRSVTMSGNVSFAGSSGTFGADKKLTLAQAGGAHLGQASVGTQGLAKGPPVAGTVGTHGGGDGAGQAKSADKGVALGNAAAIDAAAVVEGEGGVAGVQPWDLEEMVDPLIDGLVVVEGRHAGAPSSRSDTQIFISPHPAWTAATAHMSSLPSPLAGPGDGNHDCEGWASKAAPVPAPPQHPAPPSPRPTTRPKSTQQLPNIIGKAQTGSSAALWNTGLLVVAGERSDKEQQHGSSSSSLQVLRSTFSGSHLTGLQPHPPHQPAPPLSPLRHNGSMSVGVGGNGSAALLDGNPYRGNSRASVLSMSGPNTSPAARGSHDGMGSALSSQSGSSSGGSSAWASHDVGGVGRAQGVARTPMSLSGSSPHPTAAKPSLLSGMHSIVSSRLSVDSQVPASGQPLMADDASHGPQTHQLPLFQVQRSPKSSPLAGFGVGAAKHLGLDNLHIPSSPSLSPSPGPSPLAGLPKKGPGSSGAPTAYIGGLGVGGGSLVLPKV